MERGAESSEDEDSTRRRAGRDEADCAAMGEKLPGTLCVPVPADMVCCVKCTVFHKICEVGVGCQLSLKLL